MECAPDKLAQNRWQVLDALMGAKAYRTRLLRPTGVARDCPLGSTALDNIAIETGSPINPALTSFKRPHLLGRTEGICLQTTAVIIRPKPLSRHFRHATSRRKICRQYFLASRRRLMEAWTFKRA